LINSFFEKYNNFTAQTKGAYQVKDLIARDFLDINREAGHSAGGLDGWTTEDLTLVTEKAAQKLADLFNAVEMGAPWPKVMRQA